MTFRLNFDEAAFKQLAVCFPSQETRRLVLQAIQSGRESGVKHLGIKRTEVMLCTCLVDDSGSMAENNRSKEASDAVNKMLTELGQTSAEHPHRLYCALGCLNSGLKHSFKPLEEVPPLSSANYKCGGYTPLLGAVKHVLGTVMDGSLQLSATGVNVQTATVIISDGGYNDYHGSKDPAGPFGYQDPKEIEKLIRAMTATKDHTVYGVAIGKGAKEAFLRMGIKENYILDPAHEEFSFDAALRRISRAITYSVGGHNLAKRWESESRNGSPIWEV